MQSGTKWVFSIKVKDLTFLKKSRKKVQIYFPKIILFFEFRINKGFQSINDGEQKSN